MRRRAGATHFLPSRHQSGSPRRAQALPAIPLVRLASRSRLEWPACPAAVSGTGQPRPRQLWRVPGRAGGRSPNARQRSPWARQAELCMRARPEMRPAMLLRRLGGISPRADRPPRSADRRQPPSAGSRRHGMNEDPIEGLWLSPTLWYLATYWTVALRAVPAAGCRGAASLRSSPPRPEARRAPVLGSPPLRAAMICRCQRSRSTRPALIAPVD